MSTNEIHGMVLVIGEGKVRVNYADAIVSKEAERPSI